MAEANTKQHYVQKAVLKKFSHNIGKQKCITILNLQQKKIYDNNINDVFCENDFYDLENSDNVKVIEKELKEKIEDPMSDIINRLAECCYTEFTITRQELETIKKYILMQLYRNKRNQLHYSDKIDRWKQEILYILQTPFDKLVEPNKDFLGVQNFAILIHCSFMMIVRTRGEFCINDMGYATERVFGHDNFVLFPFSPYYAILQVSPEWKLHILGRIAQPPMPSQFLTKYLSLPKTHYINREIINNDIDIWKNRDKNDEYTYEIFDITNEDAYYLNTLTLNETLNVIGVHDVNKMLGSIAEFKKRAKYGGANLNYDWFETALKKYNDQRIKYK